MIWSEINDEDLKKYSLQQENPLNFKRKSISKFYRKLDYPIYCITLRGTTSVDDSTHDQGFFFSYSHKVNPKAHWENVPYCPIELLTEIPKIVAEFLSA